MIVKKLARQIFAVSVRFLKRRHISRLEITKMFNPWSDLKKVSLNVVISGRNMRQSMTSYYGGGHLFISVAPI